MINNNGGLSLYQNLNLPIALVLFRYANGNFAEAYCQRGKQLSMFVPYLKRTSLVKPEKTLDQVNFSICKSYLQAGQMYSLST